MCKFSMCTFHGVNFQCVNFQCVNLVEPQHPLGGQADVRLVQLAPVKLLSQPPQLLDCEELVVERVLGAHSGDPLAQQLDETEMKHIY